MDDWKDGDVFFWSFKDIARSNWCKSNIAVVKGGWLIDTYWGASSNNACWSKEEADAALELTFKGNLSDFDNRQEWEAPYFAKEDCLSLNHSNSPRGNFYIRKGAARCREAMRQQAYDKLKKARDELNSAANNVEFIARAIGKIDGGVDLDQISF